MFELQVMPQIFNAFTELMLVDWDTLIIYSCVNPECIPCLKDKTKMFIEEYCFIQFSEDFINVQYGNDE